MPKIVKIPLIVLAGLLGLALILLAVVQTKWFKNYAADQATQHLRKQLGVDISIGELELSYFDALRATDVFIADQQADTLIYIQRLEADYDLFSFTNKEVRLNDVLINGGNIAIGTPKNQKRLNIQFLIDYFTPPSSGEPSSSPTLVFDKVEITNTRFHYFNENYSPPTSRAFDENDMVYTQLNGHLHDFTIIKDSLSFYLDDISGREKSGLVIEDLHAKTIISSTTMEFTDLYIQTPKSTIRDYLRFDYSSYSDFSDFIEIVQLKANLAKSNVHTQDLALFSNYLNKYNELIYGTGEINGTIADLNSKSINLKVGNHTLYNGAAKIKGLPNIEDTYFNLQVKQFVTYTPDLAPLIGLSPAPKEFLNLGNVDYKGSFTGSISDFKLAGNLTTDIGNAEAQVHYRQPKNGIVQYDGTVRSDDINLGKLLEINTVGNTSFDLQINGQGLTAKTLATSISGDIYHINYNKYDYKNINVNGNFKENLFLGSGKIVDPNFDFNFDGKLDLNQSKPVVDI